MSDQTTPDAPVPQDHAQQRQPEDPFAKFKAMADDGLKDAKEKWKHLWEHAEHFIRENPGKAMLLAVGAGVLIGLAIKDPSQDDNDASPADSQ